MSDLFKDHHQGLSSPAGAATAIVPNDSTDLATHSRAIFIGGAGHLAVELTGQPGSSVVFNNVQAGVVYPLRVSKVLSTGTTATGIVALW